MNYSTIVIPVVFLFVAIEYCITLKKKLPIHRGYENVVSNIPLE